MLAGFSRDELLHELLVAPRAALIPLADTRIIERPGWWQLVTPSLKQGGLNEVSCTEHVDDAVIDATLATYRELGIRFRWMIAPGAHAADLIRRLKERGLERSEALGLARAASPGELPASASEAGGRITSEVVTLETVDEFTRVMAEGWQSDPAPLHALHQRLLAEPAPRHHLFIARREGVAAAAASYISLERSAYLIGAVTLDAHRGRGLYRELVQVRLRHAAARGLAVATTLARAETSAPILERLGFEIIYPITVFNNI